MISARALVYSYPPGLLRCFLYNLPATGGHYGAPSRYRPGPGAGVHRHRPQDPGPLRGKPPPLRGGRPRRQGPGPGGGGEKTSFSPPPRTRRGWSGWPGRASPTFFWSGFRRKDPRASGNKPWEPPGTTSGRGRRKFWGRVGTSFSGGRPWPRWKTSWRATTPTFPWRATIPGPGSGSWPSWPPAKHPGLRPRLLGKPGLQAPWTGPGRASSACPKRRRTTSGCGSACAPGVPRGARPPQALVEGGARLP